MKKRLAIIIISIVTISLMRGAYYYSGFYRPEPVATPSYEDIILPSAPATSFTETDLGKREGNILVDLAHQNDLELNELNVLAARVMARGLAVRTLTTTDDLEKTLLGKETTATESTPTPTDSEKPPLAFVVACPTAEFTQKEKETIREFLKKGGKLFLVADPTRPGKINSLGLEFGLVFEEGYLYNLKENETNFRNIIISQFGENGLTEGLTEISLYTAGVITAPEGALALTDANTFSSFIETRTGLSPMVLLSEKNIIALYDLTFMTEPYNGFYDNNQLISNIARWLASEGQKQASASAEEKK
ncbi:MAG: hypothetical protein V1894_04380 [Chloroflexota bacterium]